MSVTPKEAFIMDDKTNRYYRDVEGLKVACVYKIKLENRYKLENSKEFKEKSYLLEWVKESYGIDHINNFFLRKELKNKNDRDWLQVSLSKDIYADKLGQLHFNFFDTFSSNLFQMSEYEIDRMSLECYVHKHKNQKAFLVKASLPYNSQNNTMSLKTFFINSELSQYINRNSHNLVFSLCRVMLYENETLRYFSKELKN